MADERVDAPPAPIEVVEEEMRAHGVRATRDTALAFLLGYMVGCEWTAKNLRDPDELRAWLRHYFASTGRRRRSERSSASVCSTDD